MVEKKKNPGCPTPVEKAAPKKNYEMSSDRFHLDRNNIETLALNFLVVHSFIFHFMWKIYVELCRVIVLKMLGAVILIVDGRFLLDLFFRSFVFRPVDGLSHRNERLSQ